MKKGLFILFLTLLFFPAKAQLKLSENARISLLTNAPTDDEVFTLYGHAAFRIFDPGQDIDYVFNYGIFSFNKPYFIYRFAKGETDYMLGVTNFQDYIIEYQMRGTTVTEQILNLTQDEKERIWQALLVNNRPENREYRYNFFFDNCATRLRDMIENNVNGKIIFSTNISTQTFRDLINYCTRNHPWQTFGCDLALGSPTDEIASPYQQMFLPEFLFKEFSEATIVASDGTKRPLVSSTLIIADGDEQIPEITFFTPLFCGILLFLFIFTITFYEWRRKKYFRLLDILLFGIAGVAGCVLSFLAFISVHPCTHPNWSLLWLHPFHLIGAILFAVKRWNLAAYYYHFINFAALTLLLGGWFFIPQHLNAAFIPLIATLWIRSGYGIIRHKLNY